jgi:dTDP-glucose 4,6-dehydratase
LVAGIFAKHQLRAILHFAAESRVDRSIVGPDVFLRTDIEVTFVLLQAARNFYETMAAADREAFHFLHVSTDEVYGTLEPNDPAFHENTPFAPNSPYAATKAPSDHLVRAWFNTYKLPTLITNCSNNYGPFQFPENLIPLVLHNALKSEPLPVYGNGLQVRDWLFAVDHCRAIVEVLDRGRIGETYNIGGKNQRSNIEVVKTICVLLDELVLDGPHRRHAQLIRFVTDRPGHDRRYAIDATKISTELGWKPEETFETGLRKTVQWYLDNAAWVEHVVSGAYQTWLDDSYAQRSAATPAGTSA